MRYIINGELHKFGGNIKNYILFGRSLRGSSLWDWSIESLRNLCIMLSNILMDMSRGRDNNWYMNMFRSRQMDMVSRGNNHRSMDMVRNSDNSRAESTANSRSSTSLI